MSSCFFMDSTRLTAGGLYFYLEPRYHTACHCVTGSRWRAVRYSTGVTHGNFRFEPWRTAWPPPGGTTVVWRGSGSVGVPVVDDDEFRPIRSAPRTRPPRSRRGMWANPVRTAGGGSVQRMWPSQSARRRCRHGLLGGILRRRGVSPVARKGRSSWVVWNAVHPPRPSFQLSPRE